MLSERVAEAIGTLVEVCGEEKLPQLGAELAADEGSFALGEIAPLQEMEVRAVISDPQAARGRRDLPPEQSRVLRRAPRAVQSQSGKALLRRRGESLERGFCHVLGTTAAGDAPTLRGCEKLTKAYDGAILGQSSLAAAAPPARLRHPQTVGRHRLLGSFWLADSPPMVSCADAPPSTPRLV